LTAEHGHEEMMKSIAGLFLSLLLSLGQGSVQAQYLAPDALVRKTIDEIVSQVKRDKSMVANSQTLLELVDTTVLPHFNFTRMTMLAVGRPWRDATPAQREQLVHQFRNLLVRTYSTALEQYRDQTIDVKPTNLKAGDSRATVYTLIKQSGGPAIPMDYRMENSPNGWKVYDVSVEGVSIVTTYRSTFNTEVTRGGIDGLIKTIADQNAKHGSRMATTK
jgi:phospholipid transport system substrate-binding protein